MRKLTNQERQLLEYIDAAGGSVCPGTDASIPKAGHKSLRRMAGAGLLTIEETDDGPRFHITELGRQEANHG